jgi:hypothetical protein
MAIVASAERGKIAASFYKRVGRTGAGWMEHR